jgi:hypothetical protein
VLNVFFGLVYWSMVKDMQEQKMVERKKDEKLGKKPDIKDTDEPKLENISGRSDQNGPGSDYSDMDKQFSQKEVEITTGRRSATGSELEFQKEIDKDRKIGEQVAGSPPTQGRKDKASSSGENVNEEKKSAEK